MNTKLTDSQLAVYTRDGFVIVRRFFSEAELAPLLDAYCSDSTVNGALYGMIDDEGEPHQNELVLVSVRPAEIAE